MQDDESKSEPKSPLLLTMRPHQEMVGARKYLNKLKEQKESQGAIRVTNNDMPMPYWYYQGVGPTPVFVQKTRVKDQKTQEPDRDHFIADGCFGAVYHAWQGTRHLVLKSFNSLYCENSEEYYKPEILQAIKERIGIIQYHHPLYQIQEYVAGDELFNILVDEENDCYREISKVVRLKIALAVVREVMRWQEQSLIHRDIKTENIRIQKVGSDYRANLVDFDMVLLADEHGQCNDDIFCGTPSAIAPELYRQKMTHNRPYHYSHKTDDFATGQCLYDILLGDMQHLDKYSQRTISEKERLKYIRANDKALEKEPLYFKLLHSKPELRPSLSAVEVELANALAQELDNQALTQTDSKRSQFKCNML